MADAGLLIGWKRVVPGAERDAVALYSAMIIYMRRLHAEGAITSFEPVLLGAHGGELNGFVLVRGEQDKLDRTRNSIDFLKLLLKANQVLEEFRVVRAHYGTEVARIMGLMAEG